MNNKKVGLTDVFNPNELIEELFRQNLLLQAHVQALHSTLTVVMAEVYKKTDNEIANVILDQINKRSANVLKNNEFLVEARKRGFNYVIKK